MASRRAEHAIALAVLAACGKPAEPSDVTTTVVIASPGCAGARSNAERCEVSIDGELDEPMWNHAPIRGVFVDDTGATARPYSEVRAVVRADAVYVALYAADEDIESTDHFDVSLGGLAVAFHAGGSASDSRVRAAVEYDGTLDQPSDDDEEWVVEAAIPRSALAPPPWPLHAKRCDVPHAGQRRCGDWRGVVEP